MNKIFSAENESGKSSAVLTLLRALAISMIFTFASFAIFAAIITYTSISEASGDILVTAVTMIAVALSGFTAAKKAASKGWMWGGLGGMVYMLVVYLAGIIAGVNIGISAKGIGILLISGIIGAIGGIAGINVNSASRHSRT